MQQPSIGRIVHYVLPESSLRSNEIRPAIILLPFNRIDAPVMPGMSNLRVFMDGPNDIEIDPKTGASRLTGDLWVGSVVYDASGKPGTWHWPVLGQAASAAIVQSGEAR